MSRMIRRSGRVRAAVSGPVTVRSASSLSNAGGNLAVPKPTGLTLNDLMIGFQIQDNDGALANMSASGWSLAGSDAGVTSGHPYEKVWTKVATGTDVSASTQTFGDSGTSRQNSVAIVAIPAGSYNTATPISAVTFSSSSTSSTSHVAPSLAGVVNGLLVTSHGTDSGGTSASYTAPSGMTEQADTAQASAGYTALEVCTLALTSTSATGTKTATCSVSRPWKGAALIVNPA